MLRRFSNACQLMKMLLIFTAIVVAIILLAGVVLGIKSQQMPLLGLLDGHLRPCPESPNCVSSETEKEDALHYIAPFPAGDSKAWASLVTAIESLGGHIATNDGQYLHATFISTLFRYVDDVEARQDVGAKVIQLRSASRVGRSDFGANRKRIETLRRALPDIVR
ncbi:MAG: DUF1499 domain-containing protein [Mariprofundaceae bacterium]|nr:DUF1499 domain-containing protein [Mariprofundaceae bacterium]